MEITVYQMTFKGYNNCPINFSFEQYSPHGRLEVGNPPAQSRYDCDTSVSFIVEVPAGAKLERDTESSLQELAWDLNGKPTKSPAHTVMALAELNLHGFRIVKQNG